MIYKNFKRCLRYYLRLKSDVPISKVGKNPAQENRLNECNCGISVESHGCKKACHL